ncbi:MAG: hypothetical protein WDM78_07200 [Puia sp.]
MTLSAASAVYPGIAVTDLALTYINESEIVIIPSAHAEYAGKRWQSMSNVLRGQYVLYWADFPVKFI